MRHISVAEEFINEHWDYHSDGMVFEDPLDICDEYNNWLCVLYSKILSGTIDPDVWDPLPKKTKKQLTYLAKNKLHPPIISMRESRTIRYRMKKVIGKAVRWIKEHISSSSACKR
jgi:hypothetical protein